MRALRLWFLRRRARKLHAQYTAVVSCLDCGHAMVQEISPTASRLAAT